MCFAPLLSDGPIVVLVLGILSRASGGLLRTVQVAGGMFLLYLALQALRAARTDTSSAALSGSNQTFYHAILMNFLSPGPYIFWSTVTGPMFLKAWSTSAAAAMAFLGGFYALLIGGFMVFVWLAGTAMKLLPRVEAALCYFSAAALMGFGVFQLCTGLTGR